MELFIGRFSLKAYFHGRKITYSVSLGLVMGGSQNSSGWGAGIHIHTDYCVIFYTLDNAYQSRP
jgi:hypothetical protein